jgi:hypothetical protein
MREIYPAEIFEKRKKYNVPVQVLTVSQNLSGKMSNQNEI